MATKTPKAKTAIIHPPPTPAELQELIRATVAEWFPRCEDVSLILVPAPGASPLELHVAGSVMDAAGLTDEFYSTAQAGRWKPVEDGEDH